MIGIALSGRAQVALSDDFEDGTLTNTNSTTNPQWTLSSASTFVATNATNLAGSFSLRSNTATTARYMSRTFTAGSLAAVNYTWRVLYRNNSATTPTSGLPSAASARTWRLWLAATAADLSAGTTYGYALVHQGTTLALMRYNSGGSTTVCSYTIANNTTYTIRVTRQASDGLWRLYVDTGTGSATTSRGSGNNTEQAITSNVYTGVECNDNSNPGTFIWDNYSITASMLTVTINSNSVVTNALAGNTYAFFSFQLTALEDISLKDIYVASSYNNLNDGKISGNAITLIRSTDNDYYTTADNTDVTSSFSQFVVESTQMKFYNNSGYTISAGTSYYYFVVGTLNNPYTGTGAPPPITFSISTTQSFPDGTSSFIPLANNIYNVNAYNASSASPVVFGTYYNWTGASSTAWGTAGNWKDNSGAVCTSAPGQYDCARIGYLYSYSNTPTVTSNTSIGSILFSTINQNANTLVVSSNTLTVNGDISTTSDVSSNNCSVTVSGAGTIAAVNLNIGDGTAPTTNNKSFTGFITSVNKLTLTGDVNLNAYDLNGNRNFDPNFLITGGTVTAANLSTALLNVSGPAKSIITLSVTNATLNFTGTSPLSDLQTTNTNTIAFNGTGATIGYMGAAQTVYTNSAITGLSGGVTYTNVVFGGSGTKTPNSGTLTVAGTFSTAASTTPTVDFTTNNTIMDVAGATTNVTGATIKQGTGAFTFTGGLSNAGTFTGSGALTVDGAFVNSSTGTFSEGTGTTTFNGAYTNNGTFTYAPGTTTFNGSTAQALADNSTNGTKFNNVNFSGTGTKTMSGTGQFSVASTGVLTMGTSATLNAGGVLTLLSDANGSAAVDVMPSGASISGSVSVQRFFTGGLDANNRGYRMMSSPVNQTGNPTLSGGSYVSVNTSTFNLNSLKNGAFTGGPGGTGSGFSGTSVGPTLYLYKETIAASSSTTSFTSGKHVGIIRVGTSDVQTLHSIDATATISSVTIPIGNGFMFYFVGNASRTTGSATTGGAPQDATITAPGYLNQGTFNVKLWYRADALLSYAAADAAARGFCMVGNPYASTINLNTVMTDNATANGISAIYVLNSRKGGTAQNFISYTNLGNSSPLLQGYAVSGGGFIVKAKATTSFLTFKESQKVPSTQLTGNGLIMSAPKADELAGRFKNAVMAMPPFSSAPEISGLYVKMEKDANVFDYTGIYFRNGYESKYDENDAPYLAPLTNTVGMASLTSDGKKTAVNIMADYHQGSRVKLSVTAATTGIYKLKLEGVRNIDTLYNIYLIDHLKKDSLDIRHYGTYAFNLVSTDTSTFGGNRFELVIRRKPLPQYLLTNFVATKVTEGVNINWNTVNESNYTGFTLEKLNKTTGEYAPLYDKQSDGSAAYNYVDHAPNSGSNIYRLKQNDIDNNISYSQPVTIFYDKNAAGSGLFSVFPNPTSEMINVSIPEPTSAATYKFKLYDSMGNLVMQKTSSTSNWSENIGSLKTGAYIVEVIKSNGASLGKGKFIKN
jgi:hypothetical protein